MSKKKYTKIASAVKDCLTIASLSVITMTSLVSAEEEANDESEKIVITGSRIQRSSAQMTTPTTIISSESIEVSGLKNLGDILNQMPAVLNGIGGTGINDSGNGGITQAGLELANLRGLGTNRTLVLVDGRRHVAGSAGTAAVDMSMIPSELIERIEIITGGASAIYGSDAVTGVINVIMKKDFEGTEIRLTHGNTAESDGSTDDVSITWGSAFGENNKGNVTAHLSFSDREEIPMTARANALLRPSFRSNPANTGPEDGIADTLFFRDVRFQALSEEGLFYVPNANYGFGNTPIVDLPFPTFADDPIEFPFGFVGYDTYTIDRDTGQFRDFVGGANCQVVPCDGGDGFRTAETNTLSVPSERVLFDVAARYQVSPDASIYGELKYGKVESSAGGQASVFHDDNFGPLIRINDDNPFRPQELVTIMNDRGLESVALAVVGLNSRSQTKRETTQFTFGGDGNFGEYNYDFYVQHGRVDSDVLQQDVLIDRYYDALDAVDDGSGNAVCRSGTAGCVAYNPIDNLASDAASAYVGVFTNSQREITQTTANFALSGELFEMPAGTVDFAGGIEYRRETSESTPDILSRSVDGDGLPLPLLGSTTGASTAENTALSIVEGSYNVAEIFGEAIIPLVDGAPGVQSLELELAVRYSDHSVTGGDTTYKSALNWAINSQFRTRYTYSRAVRAPNIRELFAPEQNGAAGMTDPCHVDNLLLGPDNSVNRIANCAALGIPADFVSQASFGTRRTTTSGNTDLLPEVSDSFTVGLVYTPTDNLNIAVDYWDIEIEDAITRFDSTDILENIVDGPSIDQNFLSLVDRDATHQITNIFLREINAAKFSASGADLDVNYSIDLNDSTLRFSFNGTYLDERLTQQNENFPDDVDSEAGEVFFPHFRALFSTIYNVDDFRIGWTINFIGESTFDKEREDEYFPDWFDNKVKAVTYHNLNVAYNLNDQYEFTFGINNLTDEEPEILPGLTSGGLLYDAIGRRYYVGFKATL